MTDLQKEINGEFTIDVKHLKPLPEFRKKWKGRRAIYMSQQRILGQDILKLCDALFGNEHLVYAINLIAGAQRCSRDKEFCFEENITRQEVHRGVTNTHKTALRTLQRLEDLYEIALDMGQGPADQRLHIFEQLKNPILHLVDFLHKRRTKRELAPLKPVSNKAINYKHSRLGRAFVKDSCSKNTKKK